MVQRGSDVESVLVAVDASELSDAALEHALTRHVDADITALHVIDIFAKSYSMPQATVGADDYWNSLDDYAEDEAQAIRQDVASTAADHGVDVTTVSEYGEPARTIVEYAEEIEADLLVIGSHGRTGLSRIVLGSVAETVLRRAPCPVTVVR